MVEKNVGRSASRGTVGWLFLDLDITPASEGRSVRLIFRFQGSLYFLSKQLAGGTIQYEDCTSRLPSKLP